MLAESLTVIGRHDDRRALAPRLASDELEKLAEVLVGEKDFTVVMVPRFAAERDARVSEVEIVGIDEVEP